MTFDEWWDEQTEGSTDWTIHERLAARDAWRAVKPKWQPIDTAPKDGTHVILLLDSGVVNTGCFRGYWKPNNLSGFALHPTHWMPLPEPPEAPND